MTKVLDRDRPYRYDHDRSVSKRLAPPRDLLGWFMGEFRAEMPDHLHSGGVWRDRKRRGDPDGYDPVGGSVTGSPRDSVPFQTFIEDSPFACELSEYEGHKSTVTHYIHPLRAALASLAGRGKDTDELPFMARALYRTGLMDGDWSEACRTFGIIEPVRKVYIEQALHRLWSRYSIEPHSMRDAVA